MTSARVLLSGVDTLHLFTRTPLRGEMPPALTESKALAAVTPRGAASSTLDFAGHPLTMKPHGARTAPFLLDSEHMAVRINPDAITNMPTVAVELRAVYLWQQGANGAASEAQRVADAMTVAGPLGDAAPPLRVSRLDLAVDFQGWLPSAADADRFTTRAGHRTMHQQRATFTGFMFGRGVVAARLYDKTTEIRTSGKGWFRRLWARSPSYDPSAPVWRLEFQLRREALRSLRIGARRGDASSGVAARRVDTWADALAEARTVWRHLTTRWLSVRGQRTKNLRQVFAPEWQALVDGGFADGTWPGSDDNLYRVAREEATATTTAQLAGYLTSGLAEYQYLRDGGATLDDALPFLVQRAQRHAAARGKPVEVRARQRVREWSRTENVIAHRASRVTHAADAREKADAS